MRAANTLGLKLGVVSGLNGSAATSSTEAGQAKLLVGIMGEWQTCAPTPDEVGTVGALLIGPEGAFITGSDFLMDGGVTAAYWFGELAPK